MGELVKCSGPIKGIHILRIFEVNIYLVLLMDLLDSSNHLSVDSDSEPQLV